MLRLWLRLLRWRARGRGQRDGQSDSGSTDVTTENGPASSDPYYAVNLSDPPLDVAPGDIITVIATYNDVTRVKVYTVVDGGQQVDMVLANNGVELVGHIGGETYAVFMQEDYAYIGVGPRLTILDISNPVSPTVVGKTAPLSGLVQDVYVTGSTAYVVDGGGGLRVVDVSNPASPIELGFYDTPGDAHDVYVTDSTAYMADGAGGLFILRFSPTYAISGQVADDSSNPIAGVMISDGAGHTTTTNSNGDYTLSGLTAGSYTLTPSKSGYTFSPT